MVYLECFRKEDLQSSNQEDVTLKLKGNQEKHIKEKVYQD